MLKTNQSDLTECETIRISHFVSKTQLLGPYERFVLWVQGCCFSCPCCLASELRDRRGGHGVSVHELVRLIVNTPETEGITISGGEPLLQAKKLAAMIKEVRCIRDTGVILYTGFRLDDPDFSLNAPDGAKELTECCDLIIDGMYKKELDDGRFGIGSSNQRLRYITDRYRGCAGQYYSVERSRKAEIRLYTDKSILIGVPSERTLDMFRELTNGCTED